MILNTDNLIPLLESNMVDKVKNIKMLQYRYTPHHSRRFIGNTIKNYASQYARGALLIPASIYDSVANKKGIIGKAKGLIKSPIKAYKNVWNNRHDYLVQTAPDKETAENYKKVYNRFHNI